MHGSCWTSISSCSQLRLKSLLLSLSKRTAGAASVNRLAMSVSFRKAWLLASAGRRRKSFQFLTVQACLRCN